MTGIDKARSVSKKLDEYLEWSIDDFLEFAEHNDPQIIGTEVHNLHYRVQLWSQLRSMLGLEALDGEES
jgi:hypothetical protein